MSMRNAYFDILQSMVYYLGLGTYPIFLLNFYDWLISRSKD